MLDRIERSALRSYLVVHEQRSLVATGRALRLSGRAADAEPLLRQALAVAGRLFDRECSPEVARAGIELANAVLDLGRPDEAQALADQARAIHATHPVLGEHYRQPLRELDSRLGRRR